jgi:hypothetical protein
MNPQRMPFLVQLLLVLWVIGAVTVGVSGAIHDPTDWIVYGVLMVGVPAVALAVYHPRYPPPTRKRSFRRDSGSDW